MEQQILNCNFSCITMQEALKEIDSVIINNEYSKYLSTVNVAILKQMNDDKRLAEIIRKESHLILCDGQPIVWASKWLGRPLPERITGIDLMEEMIKLASEKDYSVYFLGAEKKVIENVVYKYKERYPNLNIIGFRDGYFKDDTRIISEINKVKPNMIFIGMGVPKQEYFIEKLIKDKNCNVVMGVGGSFDVISGLRKRAPLWMQKCGMEWFFRLMQEPGRLWRRYLITNTYFVFKIIGEKVKN